MLANKFSFLLQSVWPKQVWFLQQKDTKLKPSMWYVNGFSLACLASIPQIYLCLLHLGIWLYHPLNYLSTLLSPPTPNLSTTKASLPWACGKTQSPVSPAQYSSGPIFLYLPNILVQVSTLSHLDDYKQPFWSFCFQSYFPMDISQKPKWSFKHTNHITPPP